MVNDNNTLETQLHEHIDKQEAFLDSFIDHGSDHELFIASYIHGHYSLVVATVLNAFKEPQNDAIKLDEWKDKIRELLSNSINKAINNHELAQQDSVDVQQLLKTLFTQ